MERMNRLCCAEAAKGCSTAARSAVSLSPGEELNGAARGAAGSGGGAGEGEGEHGLPGFEGF